MKFGPCAGTCAAVLLLAAAGAAASGAGGATVGAGDTTSGPVGAASQKKPMPARAVSGIAHSAVRAELLKLAPTTLGHLGNHGKGH